MRASTKYNRREITVQLYFAPLACSLATRIALTEAGAAADFTSVDLKAKRTAEGADFLAINQLGQVPVLRTDGGDLLTENTAILQYVADVFPDAGLAPTGGLERARLQQWLGFIGTELHKGVFGTLLDPKAPDSAKAHVRDKIALRFGHLDAHLSGREFLLEQFSVADAYLVTVLNWTVAVGPSLEAWPAVQAYHQRLLARPSVAAAIAVERPLYAEEQARRARA
jgi:glutathione S-transferase